MLLKLSRYFLSIFFVLSGCAASEELLRYSLRFEGEHLIQLSVINESNLPKRLPYNFCLSSVGDLQFEITDSNGKLYGMQVQLNDKCNVKNNEFVAPFSVLGKIFHREEIKLYYKLPESELYIKAKFCRGRDSCTESNVLIWTETKED